MDALKRRGDADNWRASIEMRDGCGWLRGGMEI